METEKLQTPQNKFVTIGLGPGSVHQITCSVLSLCVHTRSIENFTIYFFSSESLAVFCILMEIRKSVSAHKRNTFTRIQAYPIKNDCVLRQKLQNNAMTFP